MVDLWNWWFGWGAFVFLIATMFIAALVLFESLAQGRKSVAGWQIGVIAPLLLILPSVFYKLSLPAGFKAEFEQPPRVPPYVITNYVSTGDFFLWLGVLAGLASVVIAIGYFMLVASRPARPAIAVDHYMPPPPVPRPAAATGMGSNVSPGIAHGRNANGFFIAQRGDLPGRQYRLYEGRTKIGRDPGNHIVFNDIDVSREHCQVLEQSGHFTIHDGASTHGTTVNGHTVRGPVSLQDEDVVGIGPNVALVFKTWLG